MGFMKKNVVNLLIFFLSFICRGYAVFEENPPYLKYVAQIENEFVKEMKRDYGLVCIGKGGRMPRNVETIHIYFNVYKRGTLEEARELMVQAKTRLVEKVNAHQKIRPYLKNYPFTLESAEISLGFHKQNGEFYFDDSIGVVNTAREGKIIYKRVEMQSCQLPSITNSADGTKTPGKWEDLEVLVDVLEEPFTETMRIVQESKKTEKKRAKE
jgi:hypothetical protein